MNKLGLKRKPVECYSICESTKKRFLMMVNEVNKINKSVIELRLDYLLSAGMSIEDIAKLVNLVKNKYTRKKVILTIRTIDQGGVIDLTKEKYFVYIRYLYFHTKSTAIDVEYKYYDIDREYYDSMFKKRKKDIIISMHIFNKVFVEQEYKGIFEQLTNTSANITKLAIKMYRKEDLFEYMTLARKNDSLFKKRKKKSVFIAMGEIGKLSRIWPEYTNTKIAYLTVYNNDYTKELGQLNGKEYAKYRKLLAKKLKSW